MRSFTSKDLTDQFHFKFEEKEENWGKSEWYSKCENYKSYGYTEEGVCSLFPQVLSLGEDGRCVKLLQTMIENTLAALEIDKATCAIIHKFNSTFYLKSVFKNMDKYCLDEQSECASETEQFKNRFLIVLPNLDDFSVVINVRIVNDPSLLKRSISLSSADVDELLLLTQGTTCFFFINTVIFDRVGPIFGPEMRSKIYFFLKY